MRVRGLVCLFVNENPFVLVGCFDTPQSIDNLVLCVNTPMWIINGYNAYVEFKCVVCVCVGLSVCALQHSRYSTNCGRCASASAALGFRLCFHMQIFYETMEICKRVFAIYPQAGDRRQYTWSRKPNIHSNIAIHVHIHRRARRKRRKRQTICSKCIEFCASFAAAEQTHHRRSIVYPGARVAIAKGAWLRRVFVCRNGAYEPCCMFASVRARLLLLLVQNGRYEDRRTVCVMLENAEICTKLHK